MSVRVKIDDHFGQRSLGAGVQLGRRSTAQTDLHRWQKGTTSRSGWEIAAAIKADVAVIAAGGNRPDDLDVAYPAAYPGVVAVAGVLVKATGPTFP